MSYFSKEIYSITAERDKCPKKAFSTGIQALSLERIFSKLNILNVKLFSLSYFHLVVLSEL